MRVSTLLVQVTCAILSVASISTAYATERRSKSVENAYVNTRLANGTVVSTKLENYIDTRSTAARPITRRAPNTHEKLSKRLVNCWYNALNHHDIDVAYQNLKNWAGNGRDLTSFPNSPIWLSIFADSRRGQGTPFVYYCIIDVDRTGNLDVGDVNWALTQMDNTCALYTGSWYRWDGSSEIVGKAAVGQSVCVG